MGKNKQQVATEARAKKEAPEKLIEHDVKEAIARGEGERGGHDTPKKVAEQPKANGKASPAAIATVAAAQPATPSKQEQTIETLKAGWVAKGIDLSKLTVKDDGKFKLVVAGEGWPTVQVGPTGGITVLELKSYSKAFDAAMDGLSLFEKQKAREQKKAVTAAPPQPAPKAAAPEAAKAPAAEKQSVSA